MKDTVDPQIAEQLSALSKTTEEAFNSGDAAALAALYTDDAVLVNDTGPIYGREAIEKCWADVFKQFHFGNHIDQRDQYSPHMIGTAGNGTKLRAVWDGSSSRRDTRIQPRGFNPGNGPPVATRPVRAPRFWTFRAPKA
jgi:uncharacterized protein (TIGR02246 family)